MPRPEFYERVNGPEGRVHGVPFLWYFLLASKESTYLCRQGGFYEGLESYDLLKILIV